MRSLSLFLFCIVVFPRDLEMFFRAPLSYLDSFHGVNSISKFVSPMMCRVCEAWLVLASRIMRARDTMVNSCVHLLYIGYSSICFVPLLYLSLRQWNLVHTVDVGNICVMLFLFDSSNSLCYCVCAWFLAQHDIYILLIMSLGIFPSSSSWSTVFAT